MLYQYTIYPIECVYKILYLFFADVLGHYGLALIALSLLTSFIIHPFMKWAAKLQKEEKHLQEVMKPQLEIIKGESKGAEQYERIQRMYKRYGYHPVMAIRSAIGVALQIPFLMAAFYMLTKLPDIQGVSWGIVKDLGNPDALLAGYNVFPFVMTAVNLLGAYTTKGFRSRDRIQAIVIAGLFLVLLYEAPSALLIYWTCNNFWTLLGNIVYRVIEKTGISIPQFIIKGKPASLWLSDMSAFLYVVCSLILTACWFVPADVYLSNSAEIWFSFRDIIKFLALYSLIGIIILTIIYIIVKKHDLSLYLMALLLGLLLGIWLQSYIINANYGIFDGRKIQWQNFTKEGIISLVVWCMSLAIPFIAVLKLKKQSFESIAKKIAILLVGIQICSLFYIAIKNPPQNNYNEALIKEGEFEISSKDNIIVFVLDTFEAQTLEEIMKKKPNIMKGFKDFTFYPDVISVSSPTDNSVPQMLTGEVFLHQIPYKDYVSQAWNKTPYFKFLKDKNYDVRLYTFSNFANGAKEWIDNCKEISFSVNRETFNVYRSFVLFREVPHHLKKRFVVNSNDLRVPQSRDNHYKTYRKDDIGFYKELKKGLKIRADKNVFRFYHLNGQHAPYKMNSNIVKVPQTTKLEQTTGSLKIVLQYLAYMKEKNTYDNATIAVLADHGRFGVLTSLPLTMVKQPGERHQKLFINRKAISFSNLWATLLQRFDKDNKKLQFGNPFGTVNEKTRLFYQPVLTENYQDAFKEYTVTGVARNKSSWKEGRIFGAETEEVSNDYELGTVVEFTQMGDSNKYVKEGWSRAFVNNRSIGKKAAKCTFKLKETITENIVINVWARPYDSVERSVQVFINGKKIGLWKVNRNEKYSLEINRELITDNTINLELKVENPNENGPSVRVKAMQFK